MAEYELSLWHEEFNSGILNLWQEVFHEYGQDFQMNRDKLDDVTRHPDFHADGAIVASTGNRVVGFALAMAAGDCAFLSVLMVHPEFRREGVGTNLLAKTEEFARCRGKDEIRVSYRGNPVSFATGVDVGTPVYYCLLNNGYRNRGSLSLFMEIAFAEYAYRDEIDAHISQNSKAGIQFGLCGQEHRDGLGEFMAEVFPGGWENSVNGHLKGEPPYPVVIAFLGARVIGFAGPIRMGENGSGGFTGIGTHPDFRRRKIGMVLFNLMCVEFKRRGATWNTLHTGLNNPAQEIYLNAGYKVKKLIDYNLVKSLS